MNKLKLFFLASITALSLRSAKAQLVINEASNKNFTTIADEDGDYPDWIELFNAGGSTINLLNYSLTDTTSLPAQWTFPAVNILSGEYRTIFCSGKDRKPITGFVEALNSGTFSPVVGWNTHNFTTPIYWDGISNVLINICSFSSTGYITNSVFNQTATSFPSTLYAFQDGSPASCYATYGTPVNQRPNLQLNGMTIGTGTIQNSPYDYPAPYGNWYWGAHHQLMIRASELQAAGLSAGNLTSLAFDVASTDAVTYDYIDISIKLVTDSSLSAIFTPNDPNNYLHTNFKISSSGENVYLYSPSQTLLDSLLVNCQSTDVSVGSHPDASANTTIFLPATPSATNNSSASNSGYCIAPSISLASGFYSTTQFVLLTNTNGNGSHVYYTLDGSDPTPSSTQYTNGLIPVFYSCVLKAKVFKNGLIPSANAVASYFFGVNHTTPVLSVVTDNANLYGGAGIFDNWWTDWEKSAYVEYFDSSQQLIFSQPAGMQMDGGAGGSRSQAQHSFRIELNNSVVGGGSVNYMMIPDRSNRTKYSTFYLRNGSNQYLQLPYKDAAQVKGMCDETNNYYTAWRPISVYINGGYFGLYELREKIDAEYFHQYDNADKDSTDILSLSYWYASVLRAVNGSVDSFYSSYNSFLNVLPSDTLFWNLSDHYFDMKYYNDYIIGQSWMGNTDWPQNNIKIYRSDKTNFRWRFATVDQELALSPNSWTDCYFDHIGYMLGQNPGNPYINIWLRGIQNNRFRDYFINRFADVMNTSYSTARLSAIENDMFSQTVFEMQNEFARWGNPNDIPGQMNNFYNNHLTFQSQLAARTDNVRNNIQNDFVLPRQVDLTLDVYPTGSGKIHISTIQPDTYPWDGVYFDGLPVKIEAIPDSGFHFLHWGNNSLLSDTLNIVFNDTLEANAISFTAYFAQDFNSTTEIKNDGDDFVLYPSPASSQLSLVNEKGKRYANSFYQVIDLNGKVLKTGILSVESAETQIDIHTIPSSVYLLRISDANGIIKQLRFVKVGE